MRLVTSSCLFAVVVLSSVFFSGAGRADPWFDFGESALEDRYADGDFDEEDHMIMRSSGASGAGDVHGQSWVGLTGFTRQLLSGKNDVGAMVVVGLALDRIAAGPVHRISDPTPPVVPAEARKERAIAPLVRKAFARDCVAAAWRASGLGVDDARLDSIVARSRLSALLPETRLRAMRLWDDASHVTTLATTDGTDLYDAIGANLVLELRLTWRLDRLVYAGDEPTLERVRLERLDARSRLATRALEGLFAWARANVDAEQATPGSRDETEARLRASEAEATLDVLTAGWFSEATSRSTASVDDAPQATSP